MRASLVLVAALALPCLTSGCISEHVTRDGAACSDARTCPRGQRCSKDGQCLYPCPFASCSDAECGCSNVDRGDSYPAAGFSCVDGLCHYRCENFGGTPGCNNYMACDVGRDLCLAACIDSTECAAGSTCSGEGNPGGGGGPPPNYCYGTGLIDDGGVIHDDGGVPASRQLDLYNTPALPRALAAGHLSADSFVDLVVVATNSDSAYVLLGQGDGAFAGSNQNVIGDMPYWVGLGSFDPGSTFDFVFLNGSNLKPDLRPGNGNGTMGYLWQSNELPFQPTAAVIARVNYDSLDDLVAVSQPDGKLFAACPDATSQLIPWPSVATPGQPTGLAAADLDADGLDEILVVSADDYGLHLFKSDGAGVLSETESLIPVGSTAPAGLAIANFDYDQRLDVAVLMQPGAPDAAVTVAFNWPYVGDTRALTNHGDRHTAIFVGNFDGDAWTDIGTVNHGAGDEPEVVFFYNNGDGTFQPGEHFGLGGGTTGLAQAVVADFNDDGCDDVAVALPEVNKTAVLWSKTCGQGL